MVILIYIQNVPLGRHQIVALYRVIVALRTQGALRTTLHNKECLLEGGRYVKKRLHFRQIGRLRVVAQT